MVLVPSPGRRPVVRSTRTRSRHLKRYVPHAALLCGVFLLLAGLGLAWTYVHGAILARLGEPDQSLLFWYLPFLLLGIGALATGSGLALWGLHALRTRR